MNDIEQIALLYEDVRIKRTGRKSVNREDISNFLFKVTDGGRELCSIYTIRKNDSRVDPSKKAGQVMKVTGKLGACKATHGVSSMRIPELDTKVQYKKNAVLRICVSSVDGQSYNKLAPDKRTRSFDVVNINKIEAGGEVYNVI